MVGGNQYNGDRQNRQRADDPLGAGFGADAAAAVLRRAVALRRRDGSPLSRSSGAACKVHAAISTNWRSARGPTGEPIIAPLWYAAPADSNTYQLSDEFMLGNDVVVAPVLVQGAVSRDVYLPEGEWRDLNGASGLHGGWHRGYAAPLNCAAGVRARRLEGGGHGGHSEVEFPISRSHPLLRTGGAPGTVTSSRHATQRVSRPERQ